MRRDGDLPVALDTSVAIALLVQTHRAHAAVVRWWDGRAIALSGHAVAESYSVLTRLPGDLRVAPADAARLLRERSAQHLLVGPQVAGRLPDLLCQLGIAGDAVYDALVALAAAEHGAELATRDARARTTYEVVGVRVIVVADACAAASDALIIAILPVQPRPRVGDARLS